MTSKSLQDLVRDWLQLDKNEATRGEIYKLWHERNTEELERRLRTRITFGTAGLRGKMEAGWSRMNDLIVIQASQGLCAYVLNHVSGAASRGAVIGHDHRHNSERWARLTAAAFIDNGVRVYLFCDLVHTPLVPFSVKRLGAACGIMITASHNPKQDNGYKVYWENAVQIIGPHDQGISDSINRNLQPKVWATEQIHLSALCVDRTEDMYNAYFGYVAELSLSRSWNGESPIFVNTSMHGVSDRFITRAVEMFGFPPFKPVKQQQQPDPEFPTVKFPNPEEKGALDIAILTADREGAVYVLAQDPDADRFSAAEKGVSGEWMTFTGDQLGTLFASRTLEWYKSSGKPLSKLAMVASAVSSKMIEAMAQAEGFKFVECLTGFKYIGNTALDLVREGYDVPFGYEEAIGFMFGSEIRDKDGVAATVSFAELVTSLHRQGKTANSYLQELYQQYGYFETRNSYFICTDPLTVDKIFSRIRRYSLTENAPNYPRKIAGLAVTSVVDLTVGYDSTNPPDFKPKLPLSAGQMIQFRAESHENGTKIVLTTRTSGTEPKVSIHIHVLRKLSGLRSAKQIKYYLGGSGKDAAGVGELLSRVTIELGHEWLEAEKYNLRQA